MTRGCLACRPIPERKPVQLFERADLGTTLHKGSSPAIAIHGETWPHSARKGSPYSGHLQYGVLAAPGAYFPSTKEARRCVFCNPDGARPRLLGRRRAAHRSGRWLESLNDDGECSITELPNRPLSLVPSPLLQPPLVNVFSALPARSTTFTTWSACPSVTHPSTALPACGFVSTAPQT
jgi:hypothetical protein